MIAGSCIVCLLSDWLDEHFGIGLRHPIENSSYLTNNLSLLTLSKRYETLEVVEE